MKLHAFFASTIVLAIGISGCAESVPQEDGTQTSFTQNRSSPVRSAHSPGTSLCRLDQGPTGPGRQHLALVIGVGDYAAGHISDLKGTVNDANNFANLLTDANGPYALPAENICMLTDEAATLSGVLGAAKSFLLDRIDNEDHVTIFYAGHGGQVPDTSEGNQEGDNRDETLVLHDSETPVSAEHAGQDIPHLTDDVFGALLDAINVKLTEGRPGAHALTVILDSCNSLSATRGGRFTARFHDSSDRYAGTAARRMASSSDWIAQAGLETLSTSLTGDSGEENLVSVAPAGAVILAAAGDGRFALEDRGRGVFTTALLQEMTLATTPLTYSQLEWRVRAVMKDEHQVPGFHGETDALLFDTETRGSGIAHRVASVMDDKVTLVGTPIFGIGPEAEFRLYDGALEGDVSDPSLAKAIITVTGGSAVAPEAEVTGLADDAEIVAGDLAVLITPSPEARKLSIALSADLDDEVRDALGSAIESKDEYARSISLVGVTDAYEFIVGAMPDGRIGISDVEGEVRTQVAANQFAAGGLAKALSGFARQKSLRSLRGEGGGLLEDNLSLSVSLESYEEVGKPTACDPAYPVTGRPAEAAANLFEVPVCSRYQFVVEADAETLSREVQIGVLYLSSDGNIWSIPDVPGGGGSAQALRLSPPNAELGEPGNLRIVLDDVFQAFPPPEAEDEVLVFGVTAKTPVPWWSLATDVRSASRSKLEVRSQLHREINAYIDSGTRAAGRPGSDEPLSAWTITRIGVRVIGDEASLEEFATTRASSSDEGPTNWSAVLCAERSCLTE